MSYTGIEDVVEDALEVVISSGIKLKEQKYLIQNLYSFQESFDTSNTYGRHKRSFDKLGIDPTERNLVINDTWKWLSSLFELFATTKNFKTLQEFRYALVNIIYDMDLNLFELDGMKEIEGLSKNISLNKIRFILEENKEELKNKPEYFEKLNLKDLEESITIKLEEKFIYNLLLNFKSDFSKILSKLKNDEILKKTNQNIIDELPKLSESHLGLKFINKINTNFLFIPKNIIGLVDLKNIDCKIQIEYFEENCLIPKLLLNFNEILPWSKFNNLDKSFHLSNFITLLMDQEDINKNKLINNWGGWKFSNKDNLKKLEKNILDIKENLTSIQRYVRFYESNTLSSLIKKYPLEQALEINERIQEMDFINYDHSRPDSYFEIDFLGSKKLMLMLYASFLKSQDKAPTKELKVLTQEVQSLSDKSTIKKYYLEVIEDLKTRPSIFFYRL